MERKSLHLYIGTCSASMGELSYLKIHHWILHAI